MLQVDSNGHVINKKIILAISLPIQKKPLSKISGIIVHQTGGPSAQSSFNSYKAGSSGAHFLIEKDGTIYQTASLNYQTWHVGKLKARCLINMSCTPTEIKLLGKFNPSAEHKREIKKNIPDRYPSNLDSIGIELVGEALPKTVPEEKRVYEAVTKDQNDSLKWLIEELRLTLGVSVAEVFRHPTITLQKPLRQFGNDMKVVLLATLSFSLMACSTTDLSIEPHATELDIGKIVKINIIKSGQASAGDGATKKECSNFLLTREEVQNFFGKTKSVSEGDYRHMLDWSPCYIEGELILSDMSVAVWAIHKYRAGSIVLGDGETIYLYCSECQANAFP